MRKLQQKLSPTCQLQPFLLHASPEVYVALGCVSEESSGACCTHCFSQGMQTGRNEACFKNFRHLWFAMSWFGLSLFNLAKDCNQHCRLKGAFLQCCTCPSAMAWARKWTVFVFSCYFLRFYSTSSCGSSIQPDWSKYVVKAVGGCLATMS